MRMRRADHISSSPVHLTNDFSVRSPLLLRLAQGPDAPQITNHILRLAKVHLLQQIAHPRLHILHHASNICDMALLCLRLSHAMNRQILLLLPRQVARKLQSAHAFALHSQVQNHRRRQLVVRATLARRLRHFQHVDRVPAAFARRAAGVAARVLFEQHHAGEAFVELPEVRAADAAFVVEFAVDVDGGIEAFFHAADAPAGDQVCGVFGVDGRIEVVAPGGAVAVEFGLVLLLASYRGS
jgi:hypothetical protein